MGTIVECFQGDPQWFKLKCGTVSSSRAADATATLKRGGEAAARRNLRYEILQEVLTGKNAEHYVSRYMEEGTENEPRARTEYELHTGLTVDRIGFILHDDIPRVGCSPDGLIDEEGMLEIKCPKTTTHLQYIDEGIIPEEYLPQMRMQLACCPERKWNDFVSFDPRLPREYRLFIRRMEREEHAAHIADLEQKVREFIKEVNEMALRLKSHITGKTMEELLRESVVFINDTRKQIARELAGEIVP